MALFVFIFMAATLHSSFFKGFYYYLLEQFLLATRKYFIPSRIRCDKGSENMDVAKYMLLHRWIERNSVITGSSVHNLCIERLWRDVFRAVGFTFYKLFYCLEAMQLLDPLNCHHLYALHFTTPYQCIIASIQRRLESSSSFYS